MSGRTVVALPGPRRGILVQGRVAALVAMLALLASVPMPLRAQGEAGEAEPPAVRAAWQALARGDAVALMRHALAPGTGDPASFDVDDCATQRNLSNAGREQAGRIGEHVSRALGRRDAEVFSSAWCRCLETARLLDLGPPERLPPLDSFFQERARGPEQTAALERWIARRIAADDAPPAVLVTHQVNITALADVFPASGEIVIVDGRATVLARVAIDPP